MTKRRYSQKARAANTRKSVSVLYHRNGNIKGNINPGQTQSLAGAARGLSAGLQTGVPSPVGTQGWVTGRVPSWGCERPPIDAFPWLFSLPFPLSRNK